MIRVTEYRLVVLLLALVACSGDVTAPARQAESTGAASGSTSFLPTVPGLPDLPGLPGSPILPRADTSGVTLIDCPASATQSVTSRIGPSGGLLAIGNTRVIIPLGAVLFPQDFTLTVPESRFAEIRVSTGTAEHYVFQLPIAMSIDYSRCATPALDQQQLSVWNIDPDNKALLEQMIGVDNKLTHTVVFTTIHLSGYAVADRSEQVGS